MATRNTFPLALALCIPVLILCGVFYALGRAAPLPFNPYQTLLDTPLNAILGYSRCYPETVMNGAYCIHDLERGSIAFTLGGDKVKYVSVSGTTYGIRVGDLIAIYGQPIRSYRARYYASWIFESEGLRIVATSRRGDLWSRISWIMLSVIGG